VGLCAVLVGCGSVGGLVGGVCLVGGCGCLVATGGVVVVGLSVRFCAVLVGYGSVGGLCGGVRLVGGCGCLVATGGVA
jgi:hypothetical protein